MLLSQIEGFLAISRNGHLGRAASALYISQPALSARLHGLEAELGVALFTRSRRGMRLTDAGRAFLPYAVRTVEALDAGAALVRELDNGVVGELRIGATPAVSSHVLPSLLARYAARHPEFRLLIRTARSEDVVELVVSDTVDVGLARAVADARVQAMPVYDDELVLVADADHPLSGTEQLSLGTLATTRLVVFERMSRTNDATQAMFSAAGLNARTVVEVDNIDAATEMVRQGLGVGLLPATAVASDLAAGRLVRLATREGPSERRHIVALRRRPVTADVPGLAPFIDLLRQVPSYIAGASPPVSD